MKCYVHEQKEAVGACVGCGKFICDECRTEIGGKNYCKACVDELFRDKGRELEKLENRASQQQTAPMVFMNAGGGSSSSSSSSSSSTAPSGGYVRIAPPYPKNKVGVHILLLLCTGGIGNIIYFLVINSKQNAWRATYGG